MLGILIAIHNCCVRDNSTKSLRCCCCADHNFLNRFCHGCVIKCSKQEFGSNSSSYIAIEWDPTTLHLRYQSSQEKISTEHESVERSRKQQTEPIDLYECFRAFTKEEELGEDELWCVSPAWENNSCFLREHNAKF